MEPCATDLKESRQRGRDLEYLFQKMAQLQGLLARKIPISGQFRGSGFYPTDSELDWQLFQRSGRVAFVDTKSFQGDSFPRSFLKDSQVELARSLSEWGADAGFCVWFRKVDRVVFLRGDEVARVAIGSFRPEDGVMLGNGFDFSLKKIFRERF